jgi:hypothetical protein
VKNVIHSSIDLHVGVRKFIYVSVHDYNIPDIFKNIGYFTGKKKAEDEILSKFTNTGNILDEAM